MFKKEENGKESLKTVNPSAYCSKIKLVRRTIIALGVKREKAYNCEQ